MPDASSIDMKGVKTATTQLARSSDLTGSGSVQACGATTQGTVKQSALDTHLSAWLQLTVGE